MNSKQALFWIGEAREAILSAKAFREKPESFYDAQDRAIRCLNRAELQLEEPIPASELAPMPVQATDEFADRTMLVPEESC